MSDMAKPRFCCPHCGRTVFNRRNATCEFCASALPAEIKYTPEQLALIDADHPRNELARKQLARHAEELERQRIKRMGDGGCLDVMPNRKIGTAASGHPPQWELSQQRPFSVYLPEDSNSIQTMSNSSPWFFWAILSAAFAALTAIFAKIGIKGVDSDLATLVRTAIIIIVLSTFVWFSGKWSNPLDLPARTWLFLGLSGLATGASWVCYFRALQLGEASKVAPVDKLSLVLVAVFAFAFLGERPAIQEWSGIAMVAAGVLVLAFK